MTPTIDDRIAMAVDELSAALVAEGLDAGHEDNWRCVDVGKLKCHVSESRMVEFHTFVGTGTLECEVRAKNLCSTRRQIIKEKNGVLDIAAIVKVVQRKLNQIAEADEAERKKITRRATIHTAKDAFLKRAKEASGNLAYFELGAFSTQCVKLTAYLTVEEVRVVADALRKERRS